MPKTTSRRTPALKATARQRAKPAHEPSSPPEPEATQAARTEAEVQAAAPTPSTSATGKAPRRVTKLDQLVSLLERPEGATVAQLSEITGWQSHSVRGAMAGALKKRGLTVASEKIDGVRIYRLAPAPEAQP